MKITLKQILIIIIQFTNMLGYTFTTEAEAITARNQAATHKGLPNSQGDTLFWVNYNFSSTENVYYIQHVEGLDAVLGEPSEITITIPIL